MSFAQQALELMKAEIVKHGLELLQRYPSDLLVHDFRMLERYALPGSTIAWMCGHSHTHMVRLGIHSKENEMVTYLTNMAADDHFYVMKVNSQGCQLKEVDRAGFIALAHEPVPYRRKGEPDNFYLFRGDTHVGSVVVKTEGTFQNRSYTAHVEVKGEAKAFDKVALELWCEKAVTEVAHSLFVNFEIVWPEPIAA